MKRQPVFRNPNEIQVSLEGPLTRIEKRDKSGQKAVVMAYRGQGMGTSEHEFDVPFHGATILASNRGWFDMIRTRDVNGKFKLSPLGVAVFFDQLPYAGGNGT